MERTCGGLAGGQATCDDEGVGCGLAYAHAHFGVAGAGNGVEDVCTILCGGG
jgi:hypothetical protein